MLQLLGGSVQVGSQDIFTPWVMAVTTGLCDVIDKKCKGLAFAKGQEWTGIKWPPSPLSLFFWSYHSVAAGVEELFYPISSLMQIPS